MFHYTFACQECGRKFKSTAAAEKASYNGFPKCGGTDIDIDRATLAPPREMVTATTTK
jgi:predicted nucleic acid-binding Zn ribbon protein